LGIRTWRRRYVLLRPRGEIADYDGEAAGPTDYAVVVSSDNGNVEDKFGFSVDTYPQLNLLLKMMKKSYMK